MGEEYIKGRLTVHFSVDIVSLVHKVHGRLSFMDLVEGDHIEVLKGDSYKTITVQEVLNTIVESSPGRYEAWKLGSSKYEGSLVRVKLNIQGNKRAVLTERNLKINKVITALKQGLITHEDATQALISIELEDDF